MRIAIISLLLVITSSSCMQSYNGGVGTYLKETNIDDYTKLNSDGSYELNEDRNIIKGIYRVKWRSLILKQANGY